MNKLMSIHWVIAGKRVYLWPFIWVAIITLVIALLTGCSTAKPYAELGLGYQLDGMTDQLVQTGLKDQCSIQPQFHAELGLELPNDWSLGYHHQSWLFCGGPFNSRPEIYTDDIRLTKKWGGR